MTNKQIIVDYKNLCENYSEEVGCYNTFNGSCIQEQCFTYKLLQQLQSKEQECEALKSESFTRDSLISMQEEEIDRYRKALEEIERYINNQGIDNKWNMRIQRFRSGILDIINKAKDGEQ